MTIIEVLSSALVVLAWALLTFLLPRDLKRRSLTQHYREWVRQRSYWGRAYDKWIIGDLVFYTDEFWGDVFGSLVIGFGTTVLVFVLSLWLGLQEDALKLLVGSFLASPPLLFVTAQFDRVYLARDAIRERQAIDPALNPDQEMKEMLGVRPHQIRRVIGRYASTVVGKTDGSRSS